MRDFVSLFENINIVSTKFGKQSVWINNSILSIDSINSIVEIFLKREYTSNDIFLGEEIEIRSSINGTLYSARGIVQEIVHIAPQKMKIKVDTLEIIEINVDKRENMRYTVDYDCIIKSKYITNNEMFKISDISNIGIGLSPSYQNIPIGEDVFVDVLVSENNLIKLKGKIVRKKINNTGIEYGISSLPVDDDNKVILNSLLDNLREKDIQDSNTFSAARMLRKKLMQNETI